jgi:hypothetical protein
MDAFKMKMGSINIKSITLIFLLLCLIFVLEKSDSKIQLDRHILNQPEKDQKSKISVALADTRVVSGPIENPNSKAVTDLTPEEGREWLSWTRSRGVISEEDLNYYRYYDRKTLESFAASGDLKAIDLLFDMEFLNEDENHLASYYARQGAIRGSIVDISRLVIFLHYDELLSPEENQHNFYEALALCKIQELRGDELFSAQETAGVISGYERYVKNKIVLTSEEQQKINQRAQEIYDEWQAERHKLGIGDFDNSRPDGVEKLFNHVKALSSK